MKYKNVCLITKNFITIFVFVYYVCMICENAYTINYNSYLRVNVYDGDIKSPARVLSKLVHMVKHGVQTNLNIILMQIFFG